MRSEQQARRIMPIDVMVEGRLCLVVGAGRIASRKIGHLLDAGARVRVIGSEPADDVARWARDGRIELTDRPFRARDVSGVFMAFASTNSEAVNRSVLAACRRQRVLCSSVDSTWGEADFLTPAILRRPEVTLTVSTGGQSCRRARLVKDSLVRHVHHLTRADLLVASRRKAGGRARADASAARWQAQAAERLAQLWGVHEFLLIEIGDRIELLAAAAPDPAVARLVALILDAGRNGYGPCRMQRGLAALRHTVRLAAGRLPGGADARTNTARLRAAADRGAARAWSGALVSDWIEEAMRLASPAHITRGPARAGQAESQRKCYERLVRGFQGRDANE